MERWGVEDAGLSEQQGRVWKRGISLTDNDRRKGKARSYSTSFFLDFQALLDKLGTNPAHSLLPLQCHELLKTCNIEEEYLPRRYTYCSPRWRQRRRMLRATVYPTKRKKKGYVIYDRAKAQMDRTWPFIGPRSSVGGLFHVLIVAHDVVYKQAKSGNLPTCKIIGLKRCNVRATANTKTTIAVISSSL